MDLEAWQGSLRAAKPPAMPPLAEALWWEAHGDWGRAHAIAQEIDTADGALVHAYLHRREGDQRNAAYWYRRAGRSVNKGPLDAERRQIVQELLTDARTHT